jgi:hypothetical protein
MIGGHAVRRELAGCEGHQSRIQRRFAIQVRPGGDTGERGSKRGEEIGIGIARGQVNQAFGHSTLIGRESRTGRVRADPGSATALTHDDSPGVQPAIGRGHGNRTEAGRSGQLSDRRERLTRLQRSGMDRFLD